MSPGELLAANEALRAALVEQSDRVLLLRHALVILLIPHDLETVHTPDAIRAARAALRDTE